MMPATMDTTLLRFEDVWQPAAGLHGLTLEAPRGRCTVLLGLADAGKSAVLRLVAARERLAGGRVLLAGEDLARLSPSRRGVTQYRPPEALPQGLAVAVLMAQPLRRMPAADAAARIARTLTLLGLDGQEGQRLGQIAPARQRRVALAVALVAAPPLLLLDDPLAGLDQEARRDLALLMRGVFRALGLTTLVATREAEAALLLADHLAVLEAGRCAQADTPQAIYEGPASAAVATLVGENNRLPGTIESWEAPDCQVRLDCGPLVEARHIDAGGPGSRCIVTIRPERVAVAALSAEEMGEGAIPARLRDTVFLGDHIRVLLEVGRGGALVAKRPPGSRLPRLGGPASVAWDPYAAFAYRALR